MSERPPAPDQAARDLIRERLDTNILVEAGAGSGKTQMLAERMAAGRRSGAYQVEHMAAVTFTRKARRSCAAASTSRWSARSRPKRVRRLDADAPPAASRALESRALLRRHHSLVLRPAAAGAAGRIRRRAGLLRARRGAASCDQRRWAWRDFIASAASRRPRMLRAARGRREAEGSRPRVRDGLPNDDVEFPAGDAPAARSGRGARSAGDVLEDAQQLLPAVDRRRHHVRDPEAQGRLHGAAAGAGTTLDGPRWSPSCCGRGTASRDHPEVVGRHGTAEKDRELDSALHADFHTDGRAVSRRVASSTSTGSRDPADRAPGAGRRRTPASPNVAELRRPAQVRRALLRDNAGGRGAPSSDKYRWLFVDEFQDTDPSRPRSSSCSPRGDAERRTRRRTGATCRCRPGALFVVGDPKQSIYRFRRADIDIYHTVRERIEATGGQVAPLTTNFRSVPALCEWANSVFASVPDKRRRLHAPRFAALDPHQRRAALGGARRDADARRRRGDAAVSMRTPSKIARYIRAEVDAAAGAATATS